MKRKGKGNNKNSNKKQKLNNNEIIDLVKKNSEFCNCNKEEIKIFSKIFFFKIKKHYYKEEKKNIHFMDVVFLEIVNLKTFFVFVQKNSTQKLK